MLGCYCFDFVTHLNSFKSIRLFILVQMVDQCIVIQMPSLTSVNRRRVGLGTSLSPNLNITVPPHSNCPLSSHPKNVAQVALPLRCLSIFILFSVASAACQTASGSNGSCQVCYVGDRLNQCTSTDSSGRETTQATTASCRNACCQYADGSEIMSTLCSEQSDSESESDRRTSIATILIIIFFSIPAVICIIIIITSCVQSCRQRDRLEQPTNRRGRQRQAPISAMNLNEYNMDELGPIFLDSNQNCSICLEERCNVRASCRHMYHSHCLAAWISKREKCPLCQTRQFNPVVAYCVRCMRATKLAFLSKRMEEEAKEEWRSLSGLRCEWCLRKENEGERDRDSISLDLSNISAILQGREEEKPEKKEERGEKVVEARVELREVASSMGKVGSPAREEMQFSQLRPSSNSQQRILRKQSDEVMNSHIAG